jgi:hypothetical protein
MSSRGNLFGFANRPTVGTFTQLLLTVGFRLYRCGAKRFNSSTPPFVVVQAICCITHRTQHRRANRTHFDVDADAVSGHREPQATLGR